MWRFNMYLAVAVLGFWALTPPFASGQTGGQPVPVNPATSPAQPVPGTVPVNPTQQPAPQSL